MVKGHAFDFEGCHKKSTKMGPKASPSKKGSKTNTPPESKVESIPAEVPVNLEKADVPNEAPELEKVNEESSPKIVTPPAGVAPLETANEQQAAPPYQQVLFQTPVNDVEDPKEAKKKSQGCCRRNIWLILGIIFVFLAGLAAAVFFLFPRIPQIDLVSSDLVNGVTIKITSQNYIDYTVNSIIGKGTHQGETVATINKERFLIKARDSTLVTIPIRIATPLPKSALMTCVSDPSVPIKIHLDIDLKLISWTGKKIPVDMSIDVPCPEETKRLPTMAQGMDLSAENIRKLEEQYGDLEELARKHGYM